MRSIIILLRILFLLISFYGYSQFFRKYLRPELIPGFLFCAIGSTVFLGGILNVLSPTAWCIAFAGVFLACFSLYKQDSIRRIFSWGTLFFAVGIVFFLLLLFGSKFTHYDNFSHWAVAPKIMIETNRFPNQTDLNYEFQSYPLGSAAFIYYLTEISGLSAEWFQMFAQAVLLLGLVSGIFVFTTKSSSILLAAAGAVILMSNNIDFVDLLVDTLLPLIGLAGIFFCHYYKDDLLKKLPFIIPYSVFLISVKNSGIFYVAAIICLALFYTKSERNKGVYKTAVLFSPFISLAMWKIHVKLVFPKGLTSKHSMSIANFSSVFQDKSPGDITSIVSAIFRETFSLSNAGIQLLLIALMLWLIWKYVYRTSRSHFSAMLLVMTVSYIVYQIGTIAMFLFSMPQDEAVTLAGYGRYHQSILTFLGGLLLLDFILALEEPSSGQFLQLSLSVLCCIALYVTVKPDFSFFTKQHLEGTTREQFDRLFEDYDVLPYCRYAIIVSQDREDYGYLHYLSNYRLGSQEHEILTDSQLETADWIIFDYILFFNETDVTRAFLAEHYPDVVDPVVNLNNYR